MERGRPKIIMTKMWQMMHSGETKNLNLDKDFDEKIKQNQTDRLERINQDKKVLGARRRRRATIFASRSPDEFPEQEPEHLRVKFGTNRRSAGMTAE